MDPHGVEIVQRLGSFDECVKNLTAMCYVMIWASEFESSVVNLEWLCLYRGSVAVDVIKGE